MSQQIDAAVAAIRAKHDGPFPQTAVILGSGLGQFGDDIEQMAIISYEDIPGFPVSTVQGHAGRLVTGRAGAAPVAIMQGRMHLYEGYEAAQLALPIRTLKKLGVERLILTNAAGGMRQDLPPGALMLIEDHINFTGRNPLIGPNDEDFGPRFCDMSTAYDPALRGVFQAAAEATGVPLKSGVYIQVLGPNFETPAEIRAFTRLGADAVGMSTIPECLVANHCGMAVAGLSLITNYAAGIAQHALSHQETMEEAGKAYQGVRALLFDVLARLETPSGGAEART